MGNLPRGPPSRGAASGERNAAEPGAPGRRPGPCVHGRARGGDRGGTQGLGHARGGRCRAPDGDSSGGRREDPRALEPQPGLTCPQGPQRTENARGRPPKRRKEGECTEGGRPRPRGRARGGVITVPFHYQPLPCLWLCLVSKRNVGIGGCMERETYGVRYSLWFRAGTGVSELGGRGAMRVRVTYVRVCPYGKPRREVTRVTAET